MTRKYRLERTAFIGCRNTAYMDVDDAEPCPFCGSRQVTIYPYGQGTTSYVEGVPTLYLSSATCKCRGCTAEIDGPCFEHLIEIYMAIGRKEPKPITYCPFCGRKL